MKMRMEPTEQQWRALFEQAIQLKKMKPWRWMGVGKIFAIQDPHTKINYYCSITGGEGIHDGVQIMVGEKGFAQFLHMVEVEFARLNPSEYSSEVALNRAMFDQHSFFCHFIDRADLEERDYQLIKQLGYGFKGTKQWIQFRYAQPGYLPSPIVDGEQVERLTMLMEQIIEVAKEEKTVDQIDDILSEEEQEEEMLYRMGQLTEGGQLTWYNQYGDLEEMGEDIESYLYDDEFMIRKIKGLKSDMNQYELIRFYTPIPVANDQGEMPCPSLIVLANINKHTINFEYALTHLQGKENELIEALIGHMLAVGAKPGMIYLSDEELLTAVEDFFDKSHISYDLIEYTPEADEVMYDAYQGFLQGFNEYLSLDLEKLQEELESNLLGEADHSIGRKNSSKGSKIVDIFSGKPIE